MIRTGKISKQEISTVRDTWHGHNDAWKCEDVIDYSAIAHVKSLLTSTAMISLTNRCLTKKDSIEYNLFQYMVSSNKEAKNMMIMVRTM